MHVKIPSRIVSVQAIFRIFEILTFVRVRKADLHQKVVEVGRMVAEIMHFYGFSKWPPSAILNSLDVYLDRPR